MAAVLACGPRAVLCNASIAHHLGLLRGVPCTTVERLIADMAADASDADLATVIHRAQVRHLLRPDAMERQLARATKGIGRARALIEPTGPDLREAFEKRFHAFVRRGPWLAHEPNVLFETPLGHARFDALWREADFAIELDSWRHHGDRDAFETDRGARGRRRPRRHRPQAHPVADADRDTAGRRGAARPPCRCPP